MNLALIKSYYLHFIRRNQLSTMAYFMKIGILKFDNKISLGNPHILQYIFMYTKML